jgi:hypothetical protein
MQPIVWHHPWHLVMGVMAYSYTVFRQFLACSAIYPDTYVPIVPLHIVAPVFHRSCDFWWWDYEIIEFICRYTVKYSDIFHAIQVSTIIFKSLKYIVDCCRDAGSKYGIGFMPIHHFSGNPNVMSTICIYIIIYIYWLIDLIIYNIYILLTSIYDIIYIYIIHGLIDYLPLPSPKDLVNPIPATIIWNRCFIPRIINQPWIALRNTSHLTHLESIWWVLIPW